MGKKLIIKDADFSENAIAQEYYIPQVVQAESAVDSWITRNLTWTLADDANELAGKTIDGFDLRFVNKANGQAMGVEIVFNPNGAEPIICDINCSFNTQDASEEKIVHYNLPVPYTFKNNDTLTYEVTGATFNPSTSVDIKGGCAFKRIDRPGSVPNFAFLLSSVSGYSYQPFMKLYLV